jgi:hypothetical protein
MSKGQLISECLSGVFKFFQKMNENNQTWGIIVVKFFFVCFLEELMIAKSAFEINSHLDLKYEEHAVNNFDYFYQKLKSEWSCKQKIIIRCMHKSQ